VRTVDTAHESGSWSLEDFIKHVRCEIDLSSEDGVLLAASGLQRLANNGELLPNAINAALCSMTSGEPLRFNQYSADVIMLHFEPSFQIRCCMWFDQLGVTSGDIGMGIPYGVVHDHDFSLLTVVCIGSGYQTDLWTYRRGTIFSDKSMADIRCDSVGPVEVSPGRAYLYERSKDVHSQNPPESFSATLNLIVPGPDHSWPQLQFDGTTGQAIETLSAPTNETNTLIKIGHCLRDPELEELNANVMQSATRTKTLFRPLNP
jgi:hypothetical protein